MEIFSQYDGQILAVTESPTVIEGDWPYARTVLLSFPNAGALNLWYNSTVRQNIRSWPRIVIDPQNPR